MKRLVITASGATMLLALVACGSGSAAGSSGSSASSNASGSANGRGFLRNGAAGELVQINGMTLILNTQSGDVTVVYSDTTQILKTSTGTVADIVPGKCIIASGQKDATGAVTASTVRLSEKINGSCSLGNGPNPNRTPNPSRSPNPDFTPNPNLALIAGEVAGVNGTAVTVTERTGTSRTMTVPTTIRVSKTSTASTSDLSVGNCILANGTKDQAGKVTARTLSIQPAGPSGCFTGGGFGGGLGRGFGGGAGGGGGTGGGPPAGGMDG
jgi:hypothetical protein